jgi:Glycosyltransferase
VPDLELLVAGEFWDDRAPYDALVLSLGLSARVTIRPGYVAEADFADVFGEADLAVLPYRSGTGSIVRELAFSHGLPVIATDVGAIAEGIVAEKNGDVVPAGDEEALVKALEKASSRSTIRTWQKNVASQPGKNASQWESYCEAILGNSRGGETVMASLVVYTALFGAHEKLLEQGVAWSSSARFICFTDDASLTSSTWEIVHVEPLFPADPRRSQRDIKIRGHQLLHESDVWMYIDNTVRLTAPPEKLSTSGLETPTGQESTSRKRPCGKSLRRIASYRKRSSHD